MAVSLHHVTFACLRESYLLRKNSPIVVIVIYCCCCVVVIFVLIVVVLVLYCIGIKYQDAHYCNAIRMHSSWRAFKDNASQPAAV